MTIDIYIQEARMRILTISASAGTNPDERVLVLGPYVPDEAAHLLDGVCHELRAIGYTAFQEKEIDVRLAFHDLVSILFGLSELVVFVVTNAGIDRGWQIELGQLCRCNDDALKILFFYEDQSRLPTPVRDLLLRFPVRQGNVVILSDLPRTTRTITQHVNSWFLGVA
jgi:hypothetical protein